MSRVRIKLPPRALWATELAVRIGDVNYGRHLGHDALVGLLHEARVRFFEAHGMHELDVDGASTLVVELAVRYRVESFWGDRLRIEILAGDVRSRLCELLYRVTGVGTTTVLAEAATGLAFINPSDGRLVAVPASFRAVLENREDS